MQAKLNGPKLNCFTEPEYGVPGNADSIGIITSDRLIAQNPDLVKRFVQATQRGYEYAYDHGDEAADILVKEAPEANLDPEFVRESMKTIIDGQYWGDREQIISGKQTFGLADYQGTQAYFDFLAQSDAYTDADGRVVHAAPQSKDLATDEFLKQAN